MTRILVTGAAGFLGSAVVKQLQNAGCPVRATSRRHSLPIADDYRPADLLAFDNFPEWLEGISGIIHCAGLAHQFDAGSEHDPRFHAVNCEATLRLAQAAAAQKVKRFVFVSSVSVYGPAKDPRPRNEDSPTAPVGAYAASKLAAERGLLRIAAETGLEVLILRMATLYGEGDPGNLGRLFEAIRRRRFVMIGRGQNRKSLVHRADAAEACVRLALCSKAIPSGLWNISGDSCSMREIVNAICSALDRPAPRFSCPAPIATGLLRTAALVGVGPVRTWAHRREQTVQKWRADDAYDGSRFAQEFGWRPRVPLADGLRRMAAPSAEQTHSQPLSRAA